MNKITHKFYIVGLILVLFFGLGYTQLAFFFQYESKHLLKVQENQAIENDIQQLMRLFVEIRFWEKNIFFQGTPEAERQYGLLLKTFHQQLSTLKKRAVASEILDNMHSIKQKLTDYENIFSQIVQLDTEQRLEQTLMENTYQSLLANIFRDENNSLLRPLFNLSHFQQQYLSSHRKSEYLAVKIVINALERKIEQQLSSDKRLVEYCSRYKRLLEHDFLMEKEIQLLHESFDELSTQVSEYLQAAVDITNNTVGQEKKIAKKLRQRLNTSFLVSMTLAILGIFLISSYILRQIVKPILAISEVSRNIQEGRMSERFIPIPNAPKELLELGTSFNVMLDTLANREEQVAKRTRKLNNANKSLSQEVASRKEIEKKIQNYANTQIVLLQEVNHRVKNNLVAIISMLHKEQDRADGEGKAKYTIRLNELVGRVKGLLTVHSMLSTSCWEPLPLQQLCEEVIQGAIHAIHSDKEVTVDVSFSDIRINSDQAHYLTIALNELATNSIKYGFNNRPSLAIDITIVRQEDTIILTYHDDGPGYPAEVLRGEVANTCIGYNLLFGMICQSMQGKINLANKDGATTRISFPVVTADQA